jgi:hypothetical protein
MEEVKENLIQWQEDIVLQNGENKWLGNYDVMINEPCTISWEQAHPCKAQWLLHVPPV